MAWVRKSDGWYWENEDSPKPQPEVVKNIIPVEPKEEQEKPTDSEGESQQIQEPKKTYKPKVKSKKK